jgi:EpsI family protein
MKRGLLNWLPAGILAAGLVLVQGVDAQQRMALRRPLDVTVPRTIDAFHAQDIEISEEEQRVAGMSSYVMRLYQQSDAAAAFTLYVGYYESQTEGHEIHSPRNCLPGAGWEVLSSTTAAVVVAGAPVTVNQAVVGRDGERALVLYWYQGRGRIAANEYAIKWQLLRDAALHGRTEEALVRVVVPMTTSDDGSALAQRVAAAVIPAVDDALPVMN